MDDTKPIIELLNYLLEQWSEVANRKNQSIQANSIVMISLSDLQKSKKVDIEKSRVYLRLLFAKGCFRVSNEKHLFNLQRLAGMDNTEELCIAADKPINGCMLNLEEFDTLRIFEMKLEAKGKKQKSCIRPIALENIAKKMGDTDSGNGLVRFLNDCEIPAYMINYPNTKWCMLNDLFRVLATSAEKLHQQLLLTTLEEFCHPLRYGGDKEKAKEIEDFIADQICYDSYFFGYQGKGISKVENDDPETLSVLSDIESTREERKAMRNKQGTTSGAGFEEFFDMFQQKNHRQKPHAEGLPLSVIINNQNIQQNAHSPSHSDQTNNKPKGVGLRIHELGIDWKGKALTNLHTGKEKDITGVNFAFLKALYDAQGALVSYEALAEAMRGSTVKVLSNKEVMDVRSKLIKMLKEDLLISEVTCNETIQGKDGYRISRKIYE